MRRRLLSRGLLLVTAAVLGGLYLASFHGLQPEYALVPDRSEVVNPERQEAVPAYDLLGRSLPAAEAARCPPDRLGPAHGAVRIDSGLLALGRKSFYRETFGNEVFFTDVLGLLAGPVPLWQYMKAMLALRGSASTNLRVRTVRDATVGGRLFREGEWIDTGLDVPRGAWMPLGVTLKLSRGSIKVGLSCAACHATVDPASGKVVQGAPNGDLAAGLLLALAPNSAAYFPHASRAALEEALRASTQQLAGRDGRPQPLPDAAALEEAVDAVFLSWPPGSFDATTDLVSNPTDLPDSYTEGDHPYGWSGFAAGGAFKGLAALSNNVHAQNSDALAQAEVSGPLFGLDADIFLATLLQNAAAEDWRFNPAAGRSATAWFESLDPTPGVPGVNELVPLPGFPAVTSAAPDGLVASSPGFLFNQQNHAMAAWQNSLRPPPPGPAPVAARLAAGRQVFERAGCASCHGGDWLTHNQVIAARRLGTEPSRAAAFNAARPLLGNSVLWRFDTPVPLPPDAGRFDVPLLHLSPPQLALAWGASGGGYKTPSLVGLAWSAPYLHDGGVAVGPPGDATALGVAATRWGGVAPDAAASLRALLDRQQRARVVAANEADPRLQAAHVTGRGHEFWVDAGSGWGPDAQRQLIDYLLALQAPATPASSASCFALENPPSQQSGATP